MTAQLQLFMILGAVVLLLIIFAFLKRGLMSVKYSLLWLALAVGLVIAAAFPYVVYVLRDLLDIEMPVNLVFLLMFCFVLVVLLLWSLLGGSKDGTTPTSTPQAVTSTVAGESSTEKATVPNLVGLRYATDIKGNTAYDGYRIVMVEQSSDTVAQGVVISQDPPAGTEKLMEDQIIQITVSSGPNLVEMPDIIGFTQANASKKLDALGIQYKMVMVDNDGTMAAGCVAKTDYLAGTKINTENVTVIVSIAGERDDTLVAQTGNAAESNSASPEGEAVTEGD